MPTEPPRRCGWLPLRALRWLVVGVSIFAAWRFLCLVPDRISYGGELDWMEGGVLGHVYRLLDGDALYVEPSLQFTPFIYPPLYYWLGAALSPLFGGTLSLMRGISVSCFVGSCCVLVGWGWRATGKLLPGVVGAGLFAATYQLGGAWFDVGRVDSLMVFLLLLSGFLLLSFDGRRTAIAAGSTLALAVLTKQSCLWPLLTLSSWALLARDTRQLWFAGCATTLVGLAWLSLHLSSGGWFTYYALTLPASHPMLSNWVSDFWRLDVFEKLAIPSLLLLFETCARVSAGPRLPRGGGFAAFAAGIVLLAWSSRTHMGMFDNVLMPLHALLSLGVVLALARLERGSLGSWPLEVAVLVSLLGTFWTLPGDEERQRPTQLHRARYRALVDELERSPRATWVPHQLGPALELGKSPRLHWMALLDIARGDPDMQQRLERQAQRWLAEQRFATIVWSLDDPTSRWFTEPMREHYRLATRITGPDTLTGAPLHVTGVWVPKER